MLCEICKKREAVLQFDIIMGNKRYKKYICDKCLEKLKGENQYQDFEGDNVLNLRELIKENISALLSSIAENKDSDSFFLLDEKINNEVKKCTCGASYENILKKGSLSCENCYKTFSKELKTVIEAALEEGKYDDEFPSWYKKEHPNFELIRNLENLVSALDDEDTEELKRVKEEIERLKKEGKYDGQ